jgi:hypothetical protein
LLFPFPWPRPPAVGATVVVVTAGGGATVVVVVVVVATGSEVNEASSTLACAAVLPAPAEAPPAEPVLETTPKASPATALAGADVAPPCGPVAAPIGPPPGDEAFGTPAGAVVWALVRGTLTGPVPMTRAATIDAAAATALNDAMVKSRSSRTPPALGARAVATAAPGAAASGGGRPKSGDAKTSSRVA